MNASSSPSQYVVSTKSSESPTKVSFIPENSSLIIVGTKTSKLQLWDRRLPPTEACVISNPLLSSNDMSIMDIESNRQSQTILVTIGRKVLFTSPQFLLSVVFYLFVLYLFKVVLLSIHDLSILNEFQMPDPLSFREEGGSSMHPDGTKFITVCYYYCYY